ncbi:MAG: propanediol/glycerol family dehydratase large subunit [Anaerovoracaceae bacterium]
MKATKRSKILKKKPINRDSFIVEWQEGGFSALRSKYDPKPSIKVIKGEIVEMDGKRKEDFDSLELFIAKHSIDVHNVEAAMRINSLTIAHKIIDINVSREDVIAITTAITPGKMLEVLVSLNAVEMMMGQMKMRRRKTPGNQAIVTNIKDNFVLLAADAAEAAKRGFYEIETTCAVSRNAPLNAISILVGGLSARRGILTQCSMEESLEVKMGMRGLTSYAETVSLYGTEESMDDGDDTVWSKAFLASVYASRGIKMRCTSGTGAEVLLGHSNKHSMLYLELLCIYLAKGSGIQGIQNGSISCIGITTAVPEGFLAIAAENLAVSLLDMELASGNDQTFSHSDIRRTAKLLMQMLPGTDFITSGYSAVPNFDDVFAGSNTDCDDYDDYYVMQRDLMVDGGIEPITEEEAIKVRNNASKACQAVFQGLGLPPITDDEVEAATHAYSNEEMPDRDITLDLEASKELMGRGITALDIAKTLKEQGFTEVSENLLNMLKERVSGDYLQAAAVFDSNLRILSGLNDPNDYLGPGTGYRLQGERWNKLKEKRSAIEPVKILAEQKNQIEKGKMYGLSILENVTKSEKEIVVGISPAFANLEIGLEICKLHIDILKNIVKGALTEKVSIRIMKIFHTDDLEEIAKIAAEKSSSKIGIGIQSKGRAYITNLNEIDEKNTRGYFNNTLESPELYLEIGETAAKMVREKELVTNRKHTLMGLTNYQLQMIKLSTNDASYLRRTKKPQLLKLL